MIIEDYVSFETAKLLKEKGFDESCHCFYEYKKRLYNDMDKYFPNGMKNSDHDKEGNKGISAPTLQMVMKWLREVHNVFIYIEPFITASGLQGYKPYCTKIGGEFMWINPLRKYSNTSSDTYEEAVESVIKYCLENLI